MQLGSAANTTPSTLRGLCRFLTHTQDNTGEFSDTDIDALLNNEYRDLQAYILSMVMYDWKENTTDATGTASVALVASQNNYSFPSGLVTIDRIEVNYTGDTNGYVVATPLKQESIEQALANTSNDSAIRGSKTAPIYWVRDGVIFLDPIPDAAVAAGLLLHCTILVTDLSGTTDEPVFATPFHEILAYGAAATFLLQRDNPRMGVILQRKEQMKQEMVQFYSKRDSDTRVGLRNEDRSFA